MRTNTLMIAIPKGRLGDSAMTMLKATGLATNVDESTRKLVFYEEDRSVGYMFVKPSDVITYVANGVADLGIIGKDSLAESDEALYELMDLGFGACQFAVAAPKDRRDDLSDETIRVATKYPRVAAAHFAAKNQKIELIQLNGSVELAPIVGLSDVIVDIVETGNTLKANGLEVIEVFMGISAKLITNPLSYAFKRTTIKRMVQRLSRESGVGGVS